MDNRTIEQVRKNETKLINEIKDLEQQVKKQKEVIEEVREYTKKEIREYKYAIDETTMDSDTEDIYDMVIRNFEKLLQILEKGESNE